MALVKHFALNTYLGEQLQQHFGSDLKHRDFLLAFSGGLDSSVLLHLMAHWRTKFALQLRAIHVNHGLQPQADQWAVHCTDFCQRLGLELQQVKLTIPSGATDGPEATARKKRYQACSELMHSESVLVTAHHQDDQAETVLLNLMRGSGLEGLRAMRSCRKFAPGLLFRPLLGVDNQALEAYAELHDISYIEDPSNQDVQYDRNYMRQKIIPALRQRWPSISRSLAGSAAHMDDAAAFVAEHCKVTFKQLYNPIKRSIDWRQMRRLSATIQVYLVRYWAQQSGLLHPPRRRLLTWLDQLRDSTSDSRVELSWQQHCIRRYRDQLFLLKPLPEIPAVHLPTPVEPGHFQHEQLGSLHLPAELFGDGQIEVCNRKAWRVMQQGNSGKRKQLNKILQNLAIPPWRREQIPLLVWQRQLAAVGDCWLSPELKQALEPGQRQIHWSAPSDWLEALPG